jgi:hypothetical protein
MRLFRRRTAQHVAPKQLAGVDARSGRLFVYSRSRNKDGIRYVGPLLVDLPEGTEPGELGRVVHDALAQSSSVDSTSDTFEHLLRIAGVRSWSAYVRGLRSVHIEHDGETLTLIPMDNRGARDGLAELLDLAERLDAPDDESLGAAVRRVLAAATSSGQADTASANDGEEGPLEFGRKTAWLAIRSDDAQAVTRELALEDVRPESWRRAFELQEESSTRSVFVTPPVEGWTLAVLGPAVADETLDLCGLSKVFGEAQRFASHRVSDSYEWQRWVDGAPLRRYAWIGDLGEIPFDDGVPGPAEEGLLRKHQLDAELPDGITEADEDLVLNVAAAWSVDPSTIGEHAGLPGHGLLGHLAE